VNTAEHLNEASEKVMRIREEVRTSGAPVKEVNLATEVYNSLVDIMHPDEEMFIDDIDARLDDIREGIIAAHPEFPSTADELANAVHHLVAHVNFVNAYGPEHDK
jgi:hypothetical protein